MKNATPIPKLKTYTIISINCDCSSGLKVQRNTAFRLGPRCPYCNKVLGDMQYAILGKVKATGDLTALEAWREKE